MNTFIPITPKTKAVDMFNPQTHKSECNGAFYPGLTDFIKDHGKNAVICPPIEASPLILETEQKDAMCHDTGMSSLRPPLSGMADAANRDLEFFAKLRFFSVAGYIAVVTTIMSVIVTV